MKSSRRDFLKKTGMAGLAATAVSLNNNMNDLIIKPGMENKMKFINPVDGDMLTTYDGKTTDTGLLAEIKVSAPAGLKIRINGSEARAAGDTYTATVLLKGYSNIIEADAGGEKIKMEIFRLTNAVDRYRLSLDDNIWFLKDINLNSGRYKSIFENPYLGFLKSVHDTFGTKIHLNLFYQTDGFNLSQMTDKYRSEWKDNAGWLRLSFHSLQEFPDRPYLTAGYEQVKKDCILVQEEIKRFAGEELTGPVTTIHWGTATADGCRALKDQGFKALAGYFSAEGADTVSYYTDDATRMHVNNRFLWRDNKAGIIFSRMALVINTVGVNEIVPYLDRLRSDGHKPPFADLMIHEQYFYPFYSAYQPDYREKVMTAVKWAADNGYKPAFLSECVFS